MWFRGSSHRAPSIASTTIWPTCTSKAAKMKVSNFARHTYLRRWLQWLFKTSGKNSTPSPSWTSTRRSSRKCPLRAHAKLRTNESLIKQTPYLRTLSKKRRGWPRNNLIMTPDSTKFKGSSKMRISWSVPMKSSSSTIDPCVIYFSWWYRALWHTQSSTGSTSLNNAGSGTS